MLVYTGYKHILCMIEVLIVFLAMNKNNGTQWKNYQNETATRQRQDSVTVSNAIARKMNTLLSLPIHLGRHQAAAASVVVSDPLYASSILRNCCSLCARLPPLTPPSSSYIPWARCVSLAASIVVSYTLDASYIPCPPLTPLSLLLTLWYHFTPPTPPSLLSQP